MRKKKYPVNWPIRIASILLCLVLISFHMMAGLYARYTSSANGEDYARVAMFEVIDDMESKVQVLDLSGLTPQTVGENAKKYIMNISNYDEDRVCEVALKYDIIIERVDGNSLPLKIRVNDLSGTGATSAKKEPGTLKWTNGQMQAKESTSHTYEVIIEWDTSKPDYKNAKYAEEIEMIVFTLNIEQID